MDIKENLMRQSDEIRALSSIYDNNWSVESEENRIYSIKFKDEHNFHEISLRITLPPTYPSESPPIYEINAPWLKGTERNQLQTFLEEVYLDNIGENILFMWAEMVREFISNSEPKPARSETEKKETEEEEPNSPNVAHISIYHGEPVIDRKSTFQAHLATVYTVEDVRAMQCLLLRNKKIAQATHNILAYRILGSKANLIIQDCDDDGENAAGGRLLHLLQILDIKNVAVLVSRWYGGIHLGPDRFKHINNVARSLLQQEGYLCTLADTKLLSPKKKRK